MDLISIIADLREEVKRLDAAIAGLSILAQPGAKKRRGRPPKWLVEANKLEAATQAKESSDRPSEL